MTDESPCVATPPNDEQKSHSDQGPVSPAPTRPAKRQRTSPGTPREDPDEGKSTTTPQMKGAPGPP